MKKLSYLLLLAGVGIALTSCKEEKDYFEMDTLEGIGMVLRSISVDDGSTIKPVEAIYVDYNNLVGINPNSPAMVNGSIVEAFVNPDNGMQLVIPVNCEWNKEYAIVVPQGMVYRQDDNSVVNEGFNITFNTNMGMNPEKVDKNLTNQNATPEAKSLYAQMLADYGKVMYSGAMGGVAWETGYTDYIASVNGEAGYPKIVGFDYIHLAYSPANWIDYGDITPIQKVWNAGSIPAITWHWNTPGSMTKNLYPYKPGDNNEIPDTDPIAMPGDWSGNLQLPADFFRFAEVGNVITVYASDIADGAQGSFKNGTTWGGLVDGENNYDYFNINTMDEEGNVAQYNTSFKLELTPSLLSEIKENGLIISGHDYTLDKVAFDGYICRADNLNAKSDFSATKALTPGTPQNDVINADIEKLAGYLKLIQNANIPLLFRPFHEAAGDYTWGAWFWWGKDGVGATKQLWSYLRDKLEKEYGINNLIWIWTVQTSSEGQMADMSMIRGAYPGDNMVDMVGTDLYPNEPLTDQTDQFNVVNALVDGRKIVALSEVGNLVDPEAAAASNALWSYFMNWYDYSNEGVYGFGDWNTQAVTFGGVNYANPWAAVANSPFVSNR